MWINSHSDDNSHLHSLPHPSQKSPLSDKFFSIKPSTLYENLPRALLTRLRTIPGLPAGKWAKSKSNFYIL